MHRGCTRARDMKNFRDCRVIYATASPGFAFELRHRVWSVNAVMNIKRTLRRSVLRYYLYALSLSVVTSISLPLVTSVILFSVPVSHGAQSVGRIFLAVKFSRRSVWPIARAKILLSTYLQPESKKQLPVHYTVVSTYVDLFLQYFGTQYIDKICTTKVIDLPTSPT